MRHPMKRRSTQRIRSSTTPALALAALLALAGCGPAGPSAEEVAAGHQLFKGTCSTCHGPNARGVPGQGKNLHANEFVGERSDEQMIAFLRVGRRVGDPLNTTNVDMPPRGGNPALSDDDLGKIVAYLRSLEDGR